MMIHKALFLILVCLSMIFPVSSAPSWDTTFDSPIPQSVCITPDSEIIYTIVYTSGGSADFWLYLSWDPDTMDFVNSQGLNCGIESDSAGKWSCIGAGDNGMGTVTLNVKNSVPINTQVPVQLIAEPTFFGFTESRTLVNTHTVCSVPIPEYPSSILPVTLIIGFLGAVLLIQRTREF